MENVWEFLKPQMFENSVSFLKSDGCSAIGAPSFTLNVFTVSALISHGANVLFLLLFCLYTRSYFSIYILSLIHIISKEIKLFLLHINLKCTAGQRTESQTGHDF